MILTHRSCINNHSSVSHRQYSRNKESFVSELCHYYHKQTINCCSCEITSENKLSIHNLIG